MKRWIARAVAIAFALAVGLAAQAPPAARNEHSMTGCLKHAFDPDTGEEELNAYIVTDVEGNGPKSIGIVSSTADMVPHLGHKVEVTGTAVPVKDAEDLRPAPPKAPHYMKLTAIKMLSTTCK